MITEELLIGNGYALEDDEYRLEFTAATGEGYTIAFVTHQDHWAAYIGPENTPCSFNLYVTKLNMTIHDVERIAADFMVWMQEQRDKA